QAGIGLDHIDFGGGLGVRYADETPPAAADMLAAVRNRVAARPAAARLPLFFEPGRSLVANCGSLLMRVEYLKPTAVKNFCIVDAAMNDMMRPTLYQAEMPVLPVFDREGAQVWDIVGPVCESGDFLAKERTFAAQQGDLLVMAAAGAYGMSMASNYNARSRAAEVIVDKDRVHLVRRRETTADMMALESRIPQL
ncbi:MAG: diaminopimelate decarboxylase family protein, partial [Duodenibacillus sp.]